MSFYPHSRLFIGGTRTVDVAGPHIQVFETTTGHLLHSTTLIDEEQKKSLIKSGHVRCAAVDREFKYLITSGEDKILKLWELDGLKLLSERELPKKPTSMQFTADSQTIVVSDKFGDIFSYPFIHVPLTVKQHRDALSSHENSSGGQLILGHVSPLNAFLLTSDEKYIITADRDEHIRVSWYPKGYNIEMYCLGHLKFVSAIHIPTSDPASLISGGGDPMLKIWDWMTGVVKHEVAVLDAVEPFIAVRALKRKRWYGDLDDEGEIPEGTRIKRKKGHRKGKGKEKAKEKDKEGDGDGGEGGDEDNEEDSKPEKVLVIHKIDTLPSDGGPQVVFSAVGATALFTFPYSDNFSGIEIQHFDFGRPVLDFIVGDDGIIVVSLDGQWTCREPDAAENCVMVRTVKKSLGKLIETFDTHKSLIDSLNSKGLLPADTEDFKKLDLYYDLTSMPKYMVDAENVTAEGPKMTSDATTSTTKELSKKELGRMKSKQAVLAAKVEVQEDIEAEDDAVEPETVKRARSAEWRS